MRRGALGDFVDVCCFFYIFLITASGDSPTLLLLLVLVLNWLLIIFLLLLLTLPVLSMLVARSLLFADGFLVGFGDLVSLIKRCCEPLASVDGSGHSHKNRAT